MKKFCPAHTTKNRITFCCCVEKNTTATQTPLNYTGLSCRGIAEHEDFENALLHSAFDFNCDISMMGISVISKSHDRPQCSGTGNLGEQILYEVVQVNRISGTVSSCLENIWLLVCHNLKILFQFDDGRLQMTKCKIKNLGINGQNKKPGTHAPPSFLVIRHPWGLLRVF